MNEQAKPTKMHSQHVEGVGVGMAFSYLFLDWMKRRGVELTVESASSYTALITGTVSWVRGGGIGDLIQRIKGWFK